jgi:hypothetical protein
VLKSEWQCFVEHLADADKLDRKRRAQERVGKVLYAVIFSALFSIGVGLILERLGLL